MSTADAHPGLQAPVGISVRPPHHSPGSPAAAATEHLLALKGARHILRGLSGLLQAHERH